MPSKIRKQFIADMQVAGLAESTQATYLQNAIAFFRYCRVSPEEVTQQDVQNYLISLRKRDAARETFRVARFSLQFLFTNTLQRDWVLFKKN